MRFLKIIILDFENKEELERLQDQPLGKFLHFTKKEIYQLEQLGFTREDLENVL